MRWSAFAFRLVGVIVFYGFALLALHVWSGRVWTFETYFVVLKEVSLAALILQGLEAVRLAKRLKMTVPGWMEKINYFILLTAVAACAFSLLRLMNYGPSVDNLGGYYSVVRWGINNAPVMSIWPLFLYTGFNLVVICVDSVHPRLRERIEQYFVFADLTCAIPAAGLLGIIFLCGGFGSPGSNLALAVGVGTLIFVSNTASFAVNEMDLRGI